MLEEIDECKFLDDFRNSDPPYDAMWNGFRKETVMDIREFNDEKDHYVFVSLPMRGYSVDDIRDRIAKLYKPFKKAGYKLIETVWTEPEPDDIRNHTYYLGKSISALCMADAVVFAKDWAKAPGCRIERMICNNYNIPKFDEVEVS